MRYIDYATEQIPSLNRMQLIMHKRHFFKDESEVRAVLWSLSPYRDAIDPFLNEDRSAFLAPIDPASLIQAVVLHPKVTAEAVAELKDFCVSHGLSEPILSLITSQPQF